MIYKNDSYQEIPNFPEYYINKETAKVISVKEGRNSVSGEVKELNPVVNSNGYLQYYMIAKDKRKLSPMQHQLLMRTFVDNPNNLPHINHIDGNKKNNVLSNLEWCTSKHNVDHAVRTGLLTTEHCDKKVYKYDFYGNLMQEYKSIHDAARDTGVSPSNVFYAAYGKTKYSGINMYNFTGEAKIDKYDGPAIIDYIEVTDMDTGETVKLNTIVEASKHTNLHRAKFMRRFKKSNEFYIENYKVIRVNVDGTF